MSKHSKLRGKSVRFFVIFAISAEEEYDEHGREVMETRIEGFASYDAAVSYALQVVMIYRSEGEGYYVELADSQGFILRAWASHADDFGIGRYDHIREGILRHVGGSLGHPLVTEWLPLPRGSGGGERPREAASSAS